MNKQNEKVMALSLFAGIGGFEVGMSQCGFLFTKTLEWDEKCCETLNANRKYTGSLETDISPIDITKMSPDDFSNEKIDYIVGGPPCQSFSAAGRRAGGGSGTMDMRGTLFEYYSKYVKHFKPKAFVFENVRGILSTNQGKDFKLICSSFREVGYNLYWRILNSADYGLPQLRERVFLVGIREDINIEFKFPLPTHGPDSPSGINYVTTGETIKDLQDDKEIVPPYGGKYGHLLPDIPLGENYRFYTEEMGHPEPLFAWRSKFSNFLYKMDPNDVCRTIIAYQGKYDGPFHWKNRKCTIDELKILQGFPKDFLIPHSYTEAVKQIGNSVCPPVALQIGKAIRYQIENLESMKVPLIENNYTLSFDKRKGVKAKKSKAKIVNKYSDLKQMSIFDCELANEQRKADFIKERKLNDDVIRWMYQDAELTIDINNSTTSEPTACLNLTFIGGVTSLLKRIYARTYTESWTDNMLKLLWDEIHMAVQEITTYDSLLPLYGHFTEPYPKFTISFTTDVDSPFNRFQKFTLDERILNKILRYDALDKDHEKVETILKAARNYGFDVRTHKTNKTIPEGNFRICYPFTMPNHLKSNIVWR